jgi:hypothetical protein
LEQHERRSAAATAYTGAQARPKPQTLQGASNYCTGNEVRVLAQMWPGTLARLIRIGSALLNGTFLFAAEVSTTLLRLKDHGSHRVTRSDRRALTHRLTTARMSPSREHAAQTQRGLAPVRTQRNPALTLALHWVAPAAIRCAERGVQRCGCKLGPTSAWLGQRCSRTLDASQCVLDTAMITARGRL